LRVIIFEFEIFRLKKVFLGKEYYFKNFEKIEKNFYNCIEN